MKSRSAYCFLALIAIALLISENAPARIWTNDKGQKIEAELVNATESEVVLKLATSGKEYNVALSSLSAEDNAYVAEWRKEIPAPAAPAIDNWDAEWPTLISTDVSPEITEAPGEDGVWIYYSPHYEYICDAELTKNVVKRFAVLFEATHAYVRELPFSMQKAHDEGERHKIFLFETKQSYVENGGPPGSAGVYMSGKDIIMVPLTSLGVEKGAGGYRVDYDKGNKTLPHEIVHQITDRPLYAEGSRGWFTEGMADYVATTPYRSGKFTVRGNLNSIREYVTAYGRDNSGGRALGEKIALPDLKEFFLMPYSQFLDKGSRNYGSSLLLAYYFFHWDGDGEATNVKNFVKALKEGKKGEEALEVLLNGRTYDELEVEITRAWSPRGVKFSFN